MSERLAELLALQQGVVSRRQALDCGISAGVIRGQLRGDRWQQLATGVYAAFSGEPPRLALIWSALLSAGPGAVVSHQTAAELYRLGRGPAGAIHVTVPAGRRVRRSARPALRPGPAWAAGPGMPPLVIHRSGRAGQARHPVLLPARTRIEETVIDLTQSARTFEDAFQWLCQACGSRLTTASLLRAALQQRSKVRYRRGLQAALSDIADGAHSPLEYRYVRGVERPHGLPAARRQAPVTQHGRRRYLDNLYGDYRLAVELDGQAAHPVAERWRDIHRDNSLAGIGVMTLRYSWSDITSQRCLVAAEIAAVLTQRGWPGQLRRCGAHCTAALP